ncbi:MAG TPA: hypothetical protein VJX74_12000 [Blastocatellia bacterium]|nr:hypothetical protein [Blastocatellia bacterium]
MTEAQKLTLKVEAAIKRADPNVITERTFYDEVSDRLFVTIFKGPRKTDLIFIVPEYNNGDAERINRVVEQSLERLKHTPIG